MLQNRPIRDAFHDADEREDALRPGACKHNLKVENYTNMERTQFMISPRTSLAFHSFIKLSFYDNDNKIHEFIY